MTMRRVLFIATGYLVYDLLFGLPMSLLQEHFCHASMNRTTACGYLMIAMCVVGIVFIRTALKEFERVGRWVWVKLIPSWRTT
jgi:uncharacterized membrane protein (DUF485 family)